MNLDSLEQTFSSLMAEAKKKRSQPTDLSQLRPQPPFLPLIYSLFLSAMFSVIPSVSGLDRKKSLLGLGAAHTLSASGSSRFHALSFLWQQLARDAVIVGKLSPIALGGFRFDEESSRSLLWNEFSDAELTIPELTIYQDGDSWHCIRACVVSQETKEIGAVLAKTSVQLVLPNKLAELEVVYGCLH